MRAEELRKITDEAILKRSQIVGSPWDVSKILKKLEETGRGMIGSVQILKGSEYFPTSDQVFILKNFGYQISYQKGDEDTIEMYTISW